MPATRYTLARQASVNSDSSRDSAVSNAASMGTNISTELDRS